MKGTSVSQVMLGMLLTLAAASMNILVIICICIFKKNLNPIFSKFQIRKVFHLFSTNKKQEYDRHR